MFQTVCTTRGWLLTAIDMVRGTRCQLRALEEIRRLACFAGIRDIQCEAEGAIQSRMCELKAERKRLLRRTERRQFKQAMRDLGLVEVRGAVSGRTYWE